MLRNEVKCFSLTMAQQLCKKGHKISYLKRSFDNPDLIVYCFDVNDDPSVADDLNKLIEIKKKNNKEVEAML